MAFEKMIRKNISLTNVSVSMLLIIVLFVGMFSYFSWHAVDSGRTIDNSYSNASAELQSAQSDLDTTITEMKNDFKEIGEADNTFLAAWNGLKGLGKALMIPYKYLTIGTKGYKALESTFELPEFITTALNIGIITFIILLLYAILKGEQNKL